MPNRKGRRQNQTGGRPAQQNRASASRNQPKVRDIELGLSKVDWTHSGDGIYEYKLKAPTDCPPLRLVTHVQYSFSCTGEVTWHVPNSAAQREAKGSTSGWIAIDSWEDIVLTSVARQYIPGDDDENVPATWVPHGLKVGWNCRGI
jgi:hypothetical protein